ncbi:MAG: hypothetical protein HY996_08795 [Micrococcales bacterium]|nr:hypothetical protein [Micrococcales bacterium]
MTDPQPPSVHRGIRREVARLVFEGWTVDERLDDLVVLSRRVPVPVWFNVLLLIVTAGVWIVFVLLQVLFPVVERCVVWLDAEGRIVLTRGRGRRGPDSALPDPFA